MLTHKLIPIRNSRLFPVLALLLAALILAGCTNASGGGAAPGGSGSSPEPAESWSFVDDRGITVTLPERPTRVVAQSTAAAALWSLGVEVVGVFGPQRLPDGSNDPTVGDVDLSRVTSLGEAWGELDLEKLAALKPDLIVSIMYTPPELWYVLPDVEPQVRAIAPTVGITVGQRSVKEAMQRFEELAGALGADLNAPQVAAARQRFEEASEELRAALAEKPGLTAMFGAGSLETLWVSNPPYYGDLSYFQELGMQILVPENPESYWEALSWEQALRYQADVLFYDSRTEVTQPPELAAQVPTWSHIPAVKAGQVYPWVAVPPYSWDGLATILEDVAAAVREADPHVIP